jgi:hypothetical protein
MKLTIHLHLTAKDANEERYIFTHPARLCCAYREDFIHLPRHLSFSKSVNAQNY